MAIEVKQKKNRPYYRVTNEFKDSDTTLGCKQRIDPSFTGPREQIELPLKKLQDPLMFKWDGIMHVIERGSSETFREGVVKHLIGDWDLEDEDLWAADQRRLVASFGFIPKLKIERLETPEEKTKKAERYKNKSRYGRPEIGMVKAKEAPSIPEIVDEDSDKGFTDEAIEEAEKKKPGRPKKKAE